jgi:hypothetical protein
MVNVLILLLLGAIGSKSLTNLISAGTQSQTLSDEIYQSFDGDPCVWLIDTTGGVGCHSTVKLYLAH